MRVCLKCSYKVIGISWNLSYQTGVFYFKYLDWEFQKNQLGCEEKLQVVVDKGFQVTLEYFMLLKIFSNFKHCYKTLYSFNTFCFTTYCI